MKGLESLLTTDTRKPIERLRRWQLYRVAQAYDIPFPPGAPASTMIALIEGTGIDVTQPLPEGPQLFQAVHVEDESGNHRTEFYPRIEPNATAGKEIDYHSVIEANAKAGEIADKDAEIAELKKRLAAIEGKKVTIGQLRTQAKELGLKFSSTTKKVELEALIRAHTSDGDQ